MFRVQACDAKKEDICKHQYYVIPGYRLVPAQALLVSPDYLFIAQSYSNQLLSIDLKTKEYHYIETDSLSSELLENYLRWTRSETKTARVQAEKNSRTFSVMESKRVKKYPLSMSISAWAQLNDQYIVIAGFIGEVELWNIATGKCQHRFQSDSIIEHLFVRPNGQLVYVASFGSRWGTIEYPFITKEALQAAAAPSTMPRLSRSVSL